VWTAVDGKRLRFENIDLKHIVTKAETCLVESYDSVLRYYLAGLHRRTKCYSKSLEMLKISAKMLTHKNLYCGGLDLF
jgi:insertion element IS1 protein InsB